MKEIRKKASELFEIIWVGILTAYVLAWIAIAIVSSFNAGLALASVCGAAFVLGMHNTRKHFQKMLESLQNADEDREED